MRIRRTKLMLRCRTCAVLLLAGSNGRLYIGAMPATAEPNPTLKDRVQRALGDSFVIERELGGGGMSCVFVAEEKALGRRVVVKLLPPELAAELSTERFAREIRLAAGLQQANIIPVLHA